MTEREQKKKEKDRRANRIILGRTIFLMALFGVAIFVPMLWKLWNVQIVKHQYYQELAINQQTRDAPISANRGTIYDSSGTILALSATVHTVFISPKDIVELQNEYAKAVAEGKKPDYPEPTNEFIASNLAEILDVDQEMVLERLSRTNRQFETIKTKVEEEVAAQVLAFRTDNKISRGIYLEPDTKRYYPQSSLASHVLGFVNGDNDGAYGLEAKYNETLSGEDGRVITAKNGANTEMPSRYENYISAVDGADLYLTLDANIQAMLESTLMEGIETYDVQYGGWAIAMNPKTGAILGMASYPDYDLNNYSAVNDPATLAELESLKNDSTITDEQYKKSLASAQMEQWRNKAVNSTYEPGSTFKAMVLAAALEEGVVSEEDTFVCTGKAVVADREISCSNKNGHGTQTLAEAVANSCNPAFIEIGQRLGAEKFYDYLERYNLVGSTGIDLPGEISNDNGVLVWPREDFTSKTGIVSLATASFGQRFQVTPIQLITAFSSVINGGHLMEPYVLESTEDKDGNILYQHQVTEVRQVVSEATSEKVRTILEGVVDGGTGKNAYVAGYRIGGKTGTSQILDDSRNIVSFIGFAPANDPQVIVLLAFDRPQPAVGDYTAGGYYISGGWMAAPLTGRLIANILDYMGVEKQYKAEELSAADVSVPSLVGRSLADAQSMLEDRHLSSRTVGDGEVVTGQIPAQGANIPGNSQVVLYLGEEVPTDQVEVPNVENMTPQAAQSALTNAGLYLRATGAVDNYSSSEKSISQSIEAGTMVNRGTVIEVQFIDSSVQDGAAVIH